MKKILALCIPLFAFLTGMAQVQNPVKWIATYKSVSAAEGEILITATIDKTWHTYSQNAPADGPVPTSFSFPASKHYQLVGKAEEFGAHEEFDAAFGTKIVVFTGKAEFKQKVKLSAKGPLTIVFKVEFMCCDDKMCLPPKTVDLSVKVQ